MLRNHERTITSFEAELAEEISFILAMLLVFLIYTPSLNAQAPGTFTPIGNMTAPRGGQRATLLLNGKVLITGGKRDGSTSAEIFDPVTLPSPQVGKWSLHGAPTRPLYLPMAGS